MLENLILVLRHCGYVVMLTGRKGQHKYTYNNTVT